MTEGWLTRERVLVLALLVATILALYGCLLLVQPFLPSITWALALAVITHPLYEWLSRRIGSENLAAGIAVLLVCGLIVAPAVWVTDQIVEQAANVIDDVQSGEAQQKWNELLDRTPWLASAANWITSHVDFQGELKRASASMASQAGNLLRRSLTVAIQFVLLPFVLFFLFRDRSTFLKVVRSLVPLSNRETTEVFKRISDTIHAQVFGTILVSLIQGTLGGLMFWWLGLPAPILWAVVMSFCAMVPTLGTFVVWGPAAMFLAISGRWTQALILTAWGGLAVGLIDNLLYPYLVGNRLRLHTLLVFFAIVGGITSFGASGLILGPVILSLTVALVDFWRRRTAEGRAAEEVPLMR